MGEKTVRLLVEYDGTRFAGWQLQDGVATVQGEITEAIRKVTGETVTLHGAGRTDAGVHALGQVASFRIDHRLEAERYKEAINFHLPEGIRIRCARVAEDDFHARFSAKWRRYRYLVSMQQSVHYRRQRWEIEEPLEYRLLDEAAKLVVGEHDFAPFCVVASRKESNICRIERARWYKYGTLYSFEIRGNRFLHGMVRSLVGAMVNVATVHQDNNVRNLTLERFTGIMAEPGEERIVFTAPAWGLYLVAVGY